MTAEAAGAPGRAAPATAAGAPGRAAPATAAGRATWPRRETIPCPPEEIGLLLSYACPASCRMCCFHCGPDRRETLTVQEGLAFVEQAAEVPTVHTVVFSGGEPFLFPDLLLALASSASRLGLGTKVVTNAFWAVDADTARRRLDPLVAAGLGVLEITADAFHQAHVPLARARTAALVAVEAGLELDLAAVVTKSSPTLADVIEALGPAVHIDKQAEFPCLPVGRAKTDVPREELLLKEGVPRGGCDLLRIPAIAPTGVAYACCGVAGFLPPLALGRPARVPLPGLLAEAAEMPLVLALSLGGPARLAELLTGNGQAHRVGTAFVHPCHLCHDLLSDPQTAAILTDLLEPRRLLLMLERDVDLARAEAAEGKAGTGKGGAEAGGRGAEMGEAGAEAGGREAGTGATAGSPVRPREPVRPPRIPLPFRDAPDKR